MICGAFINMLPLTFVDALALPGDGWLLGADLVLRGVSGVLGAVPACMRLFSREIGGVAGAARLAVRMTGVIRPSMLVS